VNRTQIGDNCYIGSGAVLVAPLALKDGTHVNAGAVVTQNNAEQLQQKGK